MKKNILGTIAIVVLGTLGMTVLALPLFAQKDFNMDERRLVDSYKRANPLYLAGVKQFEKGKLDKAQKKLLEALAIMPEHANAHYLLAQLQLKLKEFAKALASIISAEKNYTYIAKFQTFTHQQYLDQLRKQRQDLEEQRAQVQERLSRMPPSGGNEPASLQERGRFESWAESLTRSIQMIDSRLNTPIPPTFEIPAEYFYIHGNALFRMGMLVDAAAQYQEALRLDPTHGNTYNNLALVSFSLGKYQEALDCLLRAEGAGVKINPDFKRAVEEKIPLK